MRCEATEDRWVGWARVWVRSASDCVVACDRVCEDETGK
jgi:hypothetical protein